MARPATNDSPAARRGRKLGLATFFAIVTAFTGICAIQIIRQAWAETPGRGPVDCGADLVSLTRAIGRARARAAEAEGEQAALAAFREGLLPEWAASAAVLAACEGSPSAAARADEVLRLRYAEERAIRYEAPELAELRRNVQEQADADADADADANQVGVPPPGPEAP